MSGKSFIDERQKSCKKEFFINNENEGFDDIEIIEESIDNK